MNEFTSLILILLVVVLLAFFIFSFEAVYIKGEVNRIVNGYSRNIEPDGGMTAQVYSAMLQEITNLNSKISGITISCPSAGLSYNTDINVIVEYHYAYLTFNGNSFFSSDKTFKVKNHFTSEKGR